MKLLAGGGTINAKENQEVEVKNFGDGHIEVKFCEFEFVINAIPTVSFSGYIVIDE